MILRKLPKIKHQEGVIWLHSSCLHPFCCTASVTEDLYRQLHLNASKEVGTVWVIYVNCPHSIDEGWALTEVKPLRSQLLSNGRNFNLFVSEFKAGFIPQCSHPGYNGS